MAESDGGTGRKYVCVRVTDGSAVKLTFAVVADVTLTENQPGRAPTIRSGIVRLSREDLQPR